MWSLSVSMLQFLYVCKMGLIFPPSHLTECPEGLQTSMLSCVDTREGIIQRKALMNCSHPDKTARSSARQDKAFTCDSGAY